MRQVRVWRVDLGQPAAWVDAAASVLSPDERAHADRGTPEVRRRRLVARASLRIVLSQCLKCPPESLGIVAGGEGKPKLADPGTSEGLHFNLSRSGDCCLIAMTRIGPIGVDVEEIAPVPLLERIVTSRFAPEEADAILALDGEPRLRAFYNCWTRKEAYLKASGIGMKGLQRVTVTVDEERPAIVSVSGDDPGAWSLASVDAGPGFVACVAIRGAGQWSKADLETADLVLDSEFPMSGRR